MKKKADTSSNKKSHLRTGEITAWDQIESLIEKGRLNDASVLCENRLKKAPDDAEAYYYLALISKMEGSVGAAELLLKKSVYLNPDSHKALSFHALQYLF